MSYAVVATSSMLIQSPPGTRGTPGRRPGRPWKSSSYAVGFPVLRVRYGASLRGLYRVFNDAEYRFYRSNVAPPVEGDTPFDTAASLPHQPTDTHADGTWYFSMTYFNGVLDSGFLALDSAGSTYRRLDIDSGVATNEPPDAPDEVSVTVLAGGVVGVDAVYQPSLSLRADQWAITYTTDGSDPLTPPAVSPDTTVAIAASGVAYLSLQLPAQSHGTTVKVRVQTRRLDGATWVYSEGSTIQTATADANGPTAATGLAVWPGAIEEVSS